jgi:hypothetical protein
VSRYFIRRSGLQFRIWGKVRFQLVRVLIHLLGRVEWCRMSLVTNGLISLFMALMKISMSLLAIMSRGL